MKVELTRFRVKAGKTAKVQEWLQFLNEHIRRCARNIRRRKNVCGNDFSRDVEW